MEKKSVEKIYSWLGPIYNVVYGQLSFGDGREKSIQLLNLKGGERVLEVGVGTGLSLPLYPRNCEVHGVDLSESMLNEARKLKAKHGLKNIHLELMNASELNYEDNSFDVVSGNLFISATDEPEKALNEMKRVAKPGSTIVLMNHFKADNPIIAKMEGLFDPFAKSLGFTSTLELNPLLERVGGLEIRELKKVNFFNLWTAVSLINLKQA